MMKVVGDKEEDPSALRLAILASIEEVERQSRQIATDLEQSRRICREYFEVIESMQEDRDRWKEMFLEQARQHQTAQAMLENALVDARQKAVMLIQIVNKTRDEKGLKPIAWDCKVEDPPLGTSREYGKSMQALEGAAPTPVDGVAVRDWIASEAENKNA